MSKLMKVKRNVSRFIINHFLSGSHFYGAKAALLKFSGFDLGKNVRIEGPLWFGTVINLTIKNDVYINRRFSLDGNGSVSIGSNVDIGPDVTLATGGHLVGASSHRAAEGIIGNISIGDGCWICTRSTILANVHVGNGCVVAAGAIVNKNVPDDSLAAGVPALVKNNYE